MPSFNLTTKQEEPALVEPGASELPLRMEDLTFADPPPSRSLAHSLATLIQGMDSNSSFDPALGEFYILLVDMLIHVILLVLLPRY